MIEYEESTTDWILKIVDAKKEQEYQNRKRRVKLLRSTKTSKTSRSQQEQKGCGGRLSGTRCLLYIVQYIFKETKVKQKNVTISETDNIMS